MAVRGTKQNLTPADRRVLRLLKRRHRPRAVELAFGMSEGSVSRLRKVATEKGWSFPAVPNNSTPISVREYLAACRDADIVPQTETCRRLAAPLPETPWPHLADWPRPAAPRSEAAGAQAARVLAAVQHLRHVPAKFAGGGRYHFARECAEHLAMLIAYAPGRAYPDDPRALAPEPRMRFDPPPAASYHSCALSELAGAA